MGSVSDICIRVGLSRPIATNWYVCARPCGLSLPPRNTLENLH